MTPPTDTGHVAALHWLEKFSSSVKQTNKQKQNERKIMSMIIEEIPPIVKGESLLSKQHYWLALSKQMIKVKDINV